ncbi:MAG: sugar transferase [Ignavibacteriaceae bacterium]|nr:sugar transferase [Ignavibacteriaceae bacterium]
MDKKTFKVIILISDFLFINLSFLIYFILRIKTGWFDILILPEFLIPMLVLFIYWLVIFTFVGMYRTWFASSRFDELTTLFKSTFVGIFILFFLIFLDDFYHGVDSKSRILIFIYWGVFLFFVGGGRLFIRSLQRSLIIKGIGRRNVIIVGFNTIAHEIHDQISKHRALGLDAAAYASVYPNDLDKSYKGVKVIGVISDLTSMIDTYNAKEVIIALDKDNHDLLVDVISECDSKKVGLKIVPDLYEILSGQARTSQIYGVPLIDIMPQLMPEWEKKLKRIIDVLVSLFILLISFPVSLLTIFAIKIESPGSAFFKQERCGIEGSVFRMIKFRSMCQDAEKQSGPVWSSKNDPRITHIGKIIRKVRIDEIPQMVNVLRGEMSLVGPRPERPYFVEMLSKEIPYYKRRLKVRPGITGWAQVKHKYDETIEDVKIKLRYDLFYIENMSLRMDFKILFRTIFVVLFAKGHYN